MITIHTRKLISFLCLLLLVLALCVPAAASDITGDLVGPITPVGPIQPVDPTPEEPEEPEVTAYQPSTASEARFVPTYIKRNMDYDSETPEEIQMLYNPETAKLALELVRATYAIGKDDSWRQAMYDLGYDQLKMTENNQVYNLGFIPMEDNSNLPVALQAVNAIIGIQDVTYNGQTKHAIAIAFRGTQDLSDLLTDGFFIALDEDWLHVGFALNARDMYKNISEQISFTVDGKSITLSQIFTEMQEENSDYCMLVAGHSLGGALVDVFVGHELYEAGVHPSNVVGYAFAPAKSASTFYDYPYSNIFNIINEDDIIPYVGADTHIGTNFYYAPDDTFREAYYSEFAPGYSTGWWRSIVGALASNLSAHSGRGVYPHIAEKIEENLSSYTGYSTSADNEWTQTVTLNSSCFGNFAGSISSTGPVTFQNHSLHVGGDLNLDFSMIMQHPDDYLLVNGDLSIEPRQEQSDHLSAGTVELKGDVYLDNLVTDNYAYYETGTHKTIFSGDGYQEFWGSNVYQAQFENLYLENPHVDFGTTIAQLKLREDTTITATENLRIAGSLELNGYTLTVQHPTLLVELGRENTLNGKLLISGNLLAQDTLTFDQAEIRITGNCELRESLVMQHEDDYLLVRGDFIVEHGTYPDDPVGADHLTAGTVELKGNYIQHNGNGSSYYAYCETGTHQTIFSGDKSQRIIMSNTREIDQFYNLVLTNPLVDLGVVHRMRLGADATITETPRLTVNNLLDLNGHTLSLSGDADIRAMQTAENDTGHLQVAGNLFLYETAVSGQITVGGNLESTKALTFADATVTVGGSCALSESLVMRHPGDYLLVCGNLDIEEHTQIPEDHLTAGTVEVKGWFRVDRYSPDRSYWETGSHRTIFSGTAEQDIYLNSSANQFWNPIIRNPLVNFRSKIASLVLQADTSITGTPNLQVGILDLNGHHLIYTGRLTLDTPASTASGSMLQVSSQKGVVSVSGIVSEEMPVRVLVIGYDSHNRMLVCEVITVSSAAAVQSIDTTQWSNCTTIKTFILDDSYVPLSPTIPVS